MSSPPLELQAIILGLVQGVCEFFPVSSSAHLVMLPEILGWPYLGKGFDVALHAGTLLALVAHFRQELAALGRAAQRLLFHAGRASDPEARLVQLLVLASGPAALAGFLLDDIVEAHLQGPSAIALFSIGWAAIMGWVDGRASTDRDIRSLTPVTALAIGCAQASALLPGTSRSGATISAALALGLTRSEAARFSLLLSIPVVAGAALFKGWSSAAVPRDGSQALVVALGVIASALAGGFCLPRFVAYLEHGDLRPFVRYRLAFGLVTLGWVLWS